MKPPELWTALLEKASQDELVVDRLMTFPDSPPEIIGFHLQQAAEKMLKAALASQGVRYRLTHNLGELIHLLGEADHQLSGGLERLRDLTPYATEWRYDFVPAEGEDDFEATLYRDMVRRLRIWVEDIVLRPAEGDGESS